MGIRRKLTKRLPRVKSKRIGYFAMAFLVLFSVLSYSLLFKPAPQVKAATIGTTDGNANSTTKQRQSVVTSKGLIVVFYNAGSVSPTGMVYSVSSDNGSTWGSAVQVDAAQTSDFSVTIDGSDNMYIAYQSSNNIYARKLTYVSGTTWTLGSLNTIVTSVNCVDTIQSGQLYYYPNISINSDGNVFVDMVSEYDYGGGGGCPPDYSYVTFYSATLTSWSQGSGVAMTAAESNPVAISGKARWMALGGILYADKDGTGSWAPVSGIVLPSSVSISYGLDQIHILYTSGGVYYRSYSISTGVMSSATAISSNANDIAGGITTDSNKVWAFYRSYVGVNSANIVYKSMSSVGVWDSSATSITTDNLNNITITTPARLMNSATVPVIWTVGTASPYTLKSAVISGLGAATDTGNQTGTLSGSLTGSSGDEIVKCGVWYYNTINIVSGMTIKVCSSNGVTGGTLELHANSVTVAGSIDGSGRGMPGGIGIYGTGGVGGDGISFTTGVAGTSATGGVGAGAYGGSAGAGGTNASGGALAGSDGATRNIPAIGGDGGNGATGTGGTGILGGYLGVGINGDTSIDETLGLGSGGGAGGTGGSGAGGGPGGNGWTSGGTFGGGSPGPGGKGAAGGLGGKGGDGGAYIKIYSTGNISVTGSVLAYGQASGTGGSGATGSAGVAGGCPTNNGVNTC